MIRDAVTSDAGALLEIYSQYISTPVTFETELPSISEFAERIRGISGGYPYLVCCEGERILGYAYAHRFHEREAYSVTAELSVYVDGSARHRGIGSILYTELLKRLKEQGIRKVISLITLPNEASVALHEKFGFVKEGELKSVGYKNGRYHDVGYYSRFL